LSFATLSAAIQTVNNYCSLLSKFFEIIGWIFLFFAGFFGIFSIKAVMNWWNKRIAIKTAAMDDQELKSSEAEKSRKRSERFFLWRDILFILGFFLLAFGRAYDRVSLWF